MEIGWERTLPLVKINNDLIINLFKGVVKAEDIVHIDLLDEGCRTTNYMISTKSENKYLLKIFYENDKSYKKDISLFNMIKNNIPVQDILKIDRDMRINNKEYIIYRYIDGNTISQWLKQGKKLTKELLISVASILGQIHNIKFETRGYLDEKLNVTNEVEPIANLFDKHINDNVKLRLGNENINKIKSIIYKYEEELSYIEKDSRLIHGDFQGTNIIINNETVSGIIDWEFCMSGSPLMDMGQFFRYEEYFDNELIIAFENEYKKVCDYKLMDNWYNISKIIDLLSLIQLMNRDEDMPNKYNKIIQIIEVVIEKFY